MFYDDKNILIISNTDRRFYRYAKILQDLSHWFKYGYVSHANQRGLYKLDLANMRYIRSIDLSPYNCVPRTLQFSSLCKYAMGLFYRYYFNVV